MKKLVALFLSLALLLGMMSFAVADEPFEISVLLPEFPADIDFVMEDNPVLAKIQELSGVKLNIQWGPNSTYGDILNTTLADKNPPMLIAATDARAPIVVNSARAGAFWDLTEAIKDAENYPNLAAGNEGVYNNIAVDGHIYGIYRSRAFPRGGVYYRCDIAKEAGIEKVPETLDELTALAEALAAYGKEHDAYAERDYRGLRCSQRMGCERGRQHLSRP